jgi:hypothetical protein
MTFVDAYIEYANRGVHRTHNMGREMESVHRPPLQELVCHTSAETAGNVSCRG